MRLPAMSSRQLACCCLPAEQCDISCAAALPLPPTDLHAACIVVDMLRTSVVVAGRLQLSEKWDVHAIPCVAALPLPLK